MKTQGDQEQNKKKTIKAFNMSAAIMLMPQINDQVGDMMGNPIY